MRPSFQAQHGMSLERASKIAGMILLGLMLLCGVTGIGAAWMQGAGLERQSAASTLLANHQVA
jgi:methyl-accepting chemotaxis protein